jgi:type II secretory pathway pseudopilin PulG
MIQQDFPRTPSPVYQKPVSRPTKAEAAAAAAAHAHAHAQAQAHAQVQAQARELALDQIQQHHHHQHQQRARQQQVAAAQAAAAHGQPSPMYYPEPIDQQLHSRMHGLSLNDGAQVSCTVLCAASPPRKNPPFYEMATHVRLSRFLCITERLSALRLV